MTINTPTPSSGAALNQWINTNLTNSCLTRTTGAVKTSGPTAALEGVASFVNPTPSQMFPFQRGIVLSTGSATFFRDPNDPSGTSSYTDPAWTGDADLEAALANGGVTRTGGGNIRSRNASVLEFDFTAATNKLSIDYIFASEEYGSFQCSSKDGFAILIRPASGGPYQNLALLPSTNTAVSVATIRDAAHNGSGVCASVNPQYFDVFSGGVRAPGNPPSPISYDGQTVVMNASTVLVPGQTYHLKIVIADDGDGNPGNTSGIDGEYDSAVFFPASGFNLGQIALGDDLNLAGSTALCAGESYTINSGLDASVYDLSWTRGSASFAGDVSSVVVTQTGTYNLRIVDPLTGCVDTQSVVVEFAPAIVPGTPRNLFMCTDPSGSYVYNLALNTPILKQGLNAATVVTYHASQLDAEQNRPPLNTNYTSAGGQTIYARVQSHNSTCFTIVSFQLLTVPTPTATAPPTLTLCEGVLGSGIAEFNLTQLRSAILGSQPANGFTVTFFTDQASADANTGAITAPGTYSSANATLYARVQSNANNTCYATTPFTVAVLARPAIGPVPANQNVCSDYILPALTDGGGYFSQPNGVGPIAVGTPISSTQTIYVYAASASTPVCSSEDSFVVTIVSPANVPEDVTACTSYALPALPTGQEYRSGPNGGGRSMAGEILTASQTVYFFIPAAAGCTANTSFEVTIITANVPAAAVAGEINVCATYALPAIVGGGAYYTAAGGPGGTNTELAVGTPINATQQIWVYQENPDGSCFAENSFRVIYTNTAIAPVSPIQSCGPYTLPALTVGGYYSSPGGVGPITATTITSSQLVYVYASAPGNAACTQEASFRVTVNPLPTAPVITGGIYCLRYELPNIGAGITYNTNADGSGTSYVATNVITQSVTLYALTAPDGAGCRASTSFRVEIIDTTINAGPDQNQCERYVLPALPTGNYFRGPNGTGGRVNAGTAITTDTTLYVYATNGTCSAQDDFLITIYPLPVITPVADVVACTSYTLPAPPTGGQYYTATDGPDGAGTLIAPANYTLTTTQDVYLYVETGGTGTVPNCHAEDLFKVTIINSNIAPANVVSCGNYRLPALPVGGYFRQPNGVDPITNLLITTDQTIYVYVATSGANCTSNSSFTVTINPTSYPPVRPDVAACNSYELPAFPAGVAWSYSLGLNGVDPVPVGYIVTNTRRIYINNNSTTCPLIRGFQVRISQVETDAVSDQTACENVGYVLPQLTVGNYYSASGGAAANRLAVGTPILTNQRVYVYAEIPGSTPLCFDEKFFDVTISPAPVIIAPEPVDSDGIAQGFSCGNYTLPALTGPGAYYPMRNGQGGQIPASSLITDTQTIYIYAETGGTLNCSSEVPFHITVNPEAPADVTECDEYILPALLPGQAYYTNAGGPGAGNTQIPALTPITATQQVYFYIASAAACTTSTFFTVTINNTPVVAPVANVSECDFYDLPPLAVGNYYNGPGATGGLIDTTLPITAPTGTTAPFTKTVYVYAATSTFPNCADEKVFTVTITPRPVIGSRSNLSQCNAYELGPLTGGNYYTQSGGNGRMLNAGEFITTTTTIYIYAPSVNPAEPGCFSESSFVVTIESANADTILPVGDTQIEACDTYALPVNGISGNPIDRVTTMYTQHYYQLAGGPDVTGQTQLNPGDAINVLTDTTTTPPTISVNDTEVFIYQRLTGRNACDDEVTVPIVVHPTPHVPAVANEDACFTYTLPTLPSLEDASGNPVNIVDPSLSYEYYTRPGGPAGGGTIIPAGTEYTATGNNVRTETIYLYAETGDNQCFTESSYTVRINSIEVPEVADLFACESYILPTLPLGQYFRGPNRTGGEILPNTVITTTTPIYINGETATVPPCNDESDFLVTIVQRPVAITPSPVVTCSLDDAGFWGEFDLTAALAEALGTQPDVAASIFETLEDAQFNTRPLTGTDLTNYRNVEATTQTLYIRLSSTLPVTCFTITPVQIRVNPRPVAQDLDPLEICDNGVSDTDLIGVFDLTDVEADVLGATQSPLQFNVEYFANLADIPASPIAAPAIYTTVSTTVYVRVTNIATGCDDVAVLELVVNPMPVANNPTPLTVCDENASGDEIEEFDLTTKIDEITGGANGVIVEFYHTFIGAENEDATDRINTPDAYTNAAPGVESIFVRVTDATTGCYRIVLLDIRVEALPTLTMPSIDDLTVCDTDGNGFGNFDLDALVPDMIGVGGPAIVVHFYSTLIGAENNLANAMILNTADFTNTNPYAQTIWVRAEDTRTGCLSEVYTLNLVVDPAPQVPDLDDLRDCDDNDLNDQDGRAEFDLTVQNADILAVPGMNPAIIIRYFANETAANDGTPMIITPERFIGANDQVIWVRIENPGFDCYSITSFVLKVDTPVDVALPTPLVLCNEALPNDGITEFDLTDKDEEILGATGQGQDNTVTYYLSAADADAGIPVPNAAQFTNTINPQTLTVVVRTIFGCESRTTLTIRVNPLPTPNIAPDALELCDDNNPGDLEEEFDLTDAEDNILQHATLTTLKYFTTLADAEADTATAPGRILDPEHYNSGTGSVWVRAELTGRQPNDPVCFQVVELPLIVNPLPFVGPIDVYGICQTNFTGFADFDLGNYRYEILGAGAVLTDYTVRYYAIDPAVTPPGILNPSLPYTYRNLTREQRIWVRAVNNITDCENTDSFLLSVEPQTIAYPVANGVFTKCDTDIDNDGLTEITVADFATISAQIIGTQAPAANYDVTYYPTQADALARTNPLPIPLTTGSVTGVWAEIRNNFHAYGCPAYTSFDIVIELLPEPEIISVNGNITSCVDFVDPTIIYSDVELYSGIPSGAGHTYQWFVDGVAIPGATQFNYRAIETGTYTVIVTGPGGNFCESLPSAGFDVIKSGPASLINDGYVVSNAFADNQTITVLVEGFGNYQFSMYEDGPWQNSNVFTNVSLGYHTIYIRDITDPDPDKRCNVVIIEDVSTIDYPLFFTPNGDGYNDFWNIQGLANFPSSQIFIFDRYGKLLKQLSPTSNTEEGEGWDGTFNGAPLPADDYWFTVTFPDGNTVREYKSHFALKR